MDSITLEQALELFKLPRTLGATAAGDPIVASIGRFGPYIKYGSKYVSLKDDPYTVTLESALECIRLKEEADANRIIQDFGVDNIQVLNGRYGPYISNKEKNARVPKDREPKSLTLEECRALLQAAPVRGRGRFGRRTAGAKAAGTGKTGADASTSAAPAAAAKKRATVTTAKTHAGNGAARARSAAGEATDNALPVAARRAEVHKVKRVAAEPRRKPAHRQAAQATAKSKTAAATKTRAKPVAGTVRSSRSGKKPAGAA